MQNAGRNPETKCGAGDYPSDEASNLKKIFSRLSPDVAIATPSVPNWNGTISARSPRTWMRDAISAAICSRASSTRPGWRSPAT